MSDQKIIFSMAGVGKIVPGGKTILKDIYLSYFYGAKIGVIGLNGSGKSTLLKIMAGVDKEFIGEAKLSDGYSVGFLTQNPEMDHEKTVKEVVMEGAGEVAELLKEYDEISMKFGEMLNPDQMNALIEKQGKIQEKIEAQDGWNLDTKLDIAMDALRTAPPEQKIGTLSGGEKRRVALCRLLIQQPDILLLDEPTNHLDAESVEWLENHLQNYKGTVIAVTHDRYFLDNVAGWILELDRGKGIPFKGNYSSWLEQKEKRLRNEEKQQSKRQRTLQRELDWINMTPKAKQSKSKARLSSYENLLKEDAQDREQALEIYIPPGPRLGDIVVNAENITMSFGEKVLYENLSFTIPKGAVVGVIGPNGAGKTTLFKLMTKQLSPETGTFEIGSTVDLAYVDQEHEELDPEQTVYNSITDGLETIKLGSKEINGRAYVSRFNFGGSDQNKKVGQLSGGEKNRLHLARILKAGANVILLDEPTNDLDINTLRALEEGIENFGGSVIVISHDRWFLDRICSHILSFEGNSEVSFFHGNYTEYEENRKQRLGTVQPKRIQYKKLIR